MIQDIHPHQFNNEFVPTSSVKAKDYVFVFNNNSILLKKNGNGIEIPQLQDINACPTEGQFLFTFNNTHCFLVNTNSSSETENLFFHEVKHTLPVNQKEIDWLSVVALQLKNWYEHNKFCGSCGHPTQIKKDERAIECTSCNRVIYPNISPAIIVAIVSNDKILLANNVNFREGFYSLIAGYVDMGESIEKTVLREVKEEVGIDVKNIRYYDSQPWPFSSSMMLGFIAEADENQPLTIDEKEIAHAAWFSRDNLPEVPPLRSIAGVMIEKFKKGELLLE